MSFDVDSAGPLAASRSLRDQVTDRLRDAILGGTLKAGDRLSVSEIAKRYGVSLMPVREAISRLESEGLIQSEARKWTRVAVPDIAKADEIYPMIIALETLALRTSGTEVRELKAINAAFEVAVAEEDVIGSLRADFAFHSELAALAGNNTLAATLAELRGQIRLLESAYFTLEARKESPVQHARIIEAIAAGNRDRAQVLLRDHWQGGHDALRAQNHEAP